MCKRTDISTILIIARTIVIGRPFGGAHFEYSANQRGFQNAEGMRRTESVLSIPKSDTIMTIGRNWPDATYIEADQARDRREASSKRNAHVIPGGFALLPTMAARPLELPPEPAQARQRGEGESS